MLSHNEAVMPDVFYRRKVKMKRTFYLVLQMGMANNNTLLTITLDFKSYSLFSLDQFDFAKMLVFFQVGNDEIMYSIEKEIQISGFLPLVLLCKLWNGRLTDIQKQDSSHRGSELNMVVDMSERHRPLFQHTGSP